MIEKFKLNQRGVIVSDAIIAVLIFSLFTGIIASLSYNIYILSSKAKRVAEVDSYIIDFYEYVDSTAFNNITEANLLSYISSNWDNNISATTGNINSLTTPFKVLIDVEDYTNLQHNTSGLVKIVSFSIKYKVGKTDNTINLGRVKTNDN